MSEQKPEREIVGRTVAIALGIIFMILIVSLAGVVADYTSIISGKDNTITTDNAQIQTLTNQNNQFKTWLNGNETLLNHTNTWLSEIQKEVLDLNKTVNLANSTVWVNDETVAGSYIYWTFSASYAGYISVNVQFSTTTKTYVELAWDAYGVLYSNTITVGINGTAVFPVLPTSLIYIIISNTLTIEAVETVTITYYY